MKRVWCKTQILTNLKPSPHENTLLNCASHKNNPQEIILQTEYYQHEKESFLGKTVAFAY